jgi:hypothetical protein
MKPPKGTIRPTKPEPLVGCVVARQIKHEKTTSDLQKDEDK